jgi:uncharacterized protein YbjT (DUF2867 family)
MSLRDVAPEQPMIPADERPIALVVGATGSQGGSVVRALVARGEYRVRAMTRAPRSEEAKALAAKGVEMVRGDLDDRRSLRTALAGARFAFGVTSYWEHFDREAELGLKLVDALAGSGVRHAVLSSRPSTKRISNGEFSIASFEGKARMEDAALSIGLPATFVHPAFFYENFLSLFVPQRQADGTYRFGFPQGDTPLAGFAVEDLGEAVADIFARGESLIGERLPLVGEVSTPAEYAEIMSAVSEEVVRYRHVPWEVFLTYGFPGAHDLANTFDFYRTQEARAWTGLITCRALFPGVRRFARWLVEHRAEFLAVLGRSTEHAIV